MRAVQFGAGKIGRGFLGQLLCESGYEVTFVDVLPDLVARLNERGEYPLRLVSASATQERVIGNVRALDAGRDGVQIARALAEADIAGTSVGVANLPSVAESLATGIAARAPSGRPLDVLLCENQWHTAALMRGLIRRTLPPEAIAFFDARIGLVETVIGRMVPAPSPAAQAEDPLLLIAEPYQ